ncbi:Seipin [Dirofilaria immitis]
MLVVKKVGSLIRDKCTLYHAVIIIFQLLGAFVIAVISPFVFRQLFFPALVEYTVPLHFNFETCREQLAGICSFPTAVIDFSVENPKLSPGEHYEIKIEIVLSESTITSNVGIFQAVIELRDQLNIKKTFRRSCFVNRYRGVIYRIGQGLWALACKTVFFPAYFLGMLTVMDDRKLEVSFTNHLIDNDLSNISLLYVQLQNRFIEVESGKLSLRINFGLLRIFLYDYPIVSSLLIICLTYFMCLTGIILYWMLQVFSGFFEFSNINYVLIDRTDGSSTPPEICTGTASVKELKTSETRDDVASFIWNDSRRKISDEVSENFLQHRNKINS